MTGRPEWMTPDPWEVELDSRKRARRKSYRSEYNKRPHVRAQVKAYLNRPDVKERMREYHREYQRRLRAARRVEIEATVVGYLHELYCTGPHRNHKACRAIPVYRREDAA